MVTEVLKLSLEREIGATFAANFIESVTSDGAGAIRAGLAVFRKVSFLLRDALKVADVENLVTRRLEEVPADPLSA